LAQHYAPEDVSGAVLATELAEDLVQRGHNVAFVTCAPNYPHGKVLDGYRNQIRAEENRNGVKVIRIWSYISPRKDFWSRIWNFATFSIMSFFGAITNRKPDVIFSYSPPLPLGVSAWCLSLLWQVPWVLRVEDLYPDAAVATGVLRNRRAISLFKRLEKFLYKKANYISLISEGFRKNLLDKGVPDEKLSIAPVWADSAMFRTIPKENSFRFRNGMQGKFVVLYAGNLGITSAMEDVIAGAALLRDYPEIIFLLVGDGVKKDNLVQQAHGLEQVIFLPYQPRTSLPEMYACADIGLVTLNEKSSPYSMPSKMFNIMASQRPIVAVAPMESEVTYILNAAQCGVTVRPGNPELFAKKILELKSMSALLDTWSSNGRLYLAEHFSRRKSLDLYESTLRRALG